MTGFGAAPTRRGFLGGVALALLVARSPARAAAAPARAVLSPADQADLDRIQAYLNGIKTVTGKFEQTNPDGSVSTGTVWLSRPGKMRFDYDPPTKLLIVCDGNFIEVNDKSLDDIQFVPVKAFYRWERNHARATWPPARSSGSVMVGARRSRRYMAGTKTSVAKVAKSRPPMTARAKGAFCSPPSPTPRAIGIMPSTMAPAVISTGLSRV